MLSLCPEYVSMYEALEETKEISKVKCTLGLYFKAIHMSCFRRCPRRMDCEPHFAYYLACEISSERKY